MDRFYNWTCSCQSLLYEPGVHREVSEWTRRYIQFTAGKINEASGATGCRCVFATQREVLVSTGRLREPRDCEEELQTFLSRLRWNDPVLHNFPAVNMNT
eukprot:GHVU01017620.1.p4 GENE.GHVU01017620.1~~GHVU01017620.1.p4  ORF type:complete len:100 (+),score=21.06 GHVU01017620.1:254-553(+)